MIRFAIPSSLAKSAANLAIYNLRGELIRRQLPAGNHITRWDGKDDTGRETASGIYLYRLRVGSVTEMRKLSLVK